jgi:hypothetical protein
MTLESDLQEAIKKNLSEEVGAVLRKRLEQAETDACKLARLEREKAQWDRDSQKHRDLDTRESLLKDREGKVAAREHELKHLDEIRDLKIKHAEERNKDLRDITHQVFSSPVFRRTIESSGQVPVYQPPDGRGNGGYHSTMAETKKVDETTREQ